jgi:hypothetical protein
MLQIQCLEPKSSLSKAIIRQRLDVSVSVPAYSNEFVAQTVFSQWHLLSVLYLWNSRSNVAVPAKLPRSPLASSIAVRLMMLGQMRIGHFCSLYLFERVARTLTTTLSPAAEAFASMMSGPGAAASGRARCCCGCCRPASCTACLESELRAMPNTGVPAMVANMRCSGSAVVDTSQTPDAVCAAPGLPMLHLVINIKPRLLRIQLIRKVKDHSARHSTCHSTRAAPLDRRIQTPVGPGCIWPHCRSTCAA